MPRELAETERVIPPPITHAEITHVSILRQEGGFRVHVVEALGRVEDQKFQDGGEQFRRLTTASLPPTDLPFLDSLLAAVATQAEADRLAEEERRRQAAVGQEDPTTEPERTR